MWIYHKKWFAEKSRTTQEDWWANQWSMEWFPRVDWSSSGCDRTWNHIGRQSKSQNDNYLFMLSCHIGDDVEMVLVQLHKIGERSNGWRNTSRELIGVQVAVVEHGFKHIDQWGKSWLIALWFMWALKNHSIIDSLVMSRVLVQVIKIRERSNGWWNASRELIGVQVAVIEKWNQAHRSVRKELIDCIVIHVSTESLDYR